MKNIGLLRFFVLLFGCADPFETNTNQLTGPRVLSAYYDGEQGMVQLWDGDSYFEQAPMVEWWSSGQKVAEGPVMSGNVDLPLTIKAELDGTVLESIIHAPTAAASISPTLHLPASDVLAETMVDEIDLIDFIGERTTTGVNEDVLIARIPQSSSPRWSNWSFQSSAGSVVPYSHDLAVLSRSQLTIDEGVLSVGNSALASWGSLYIVQQNDSLDSGWIDVLWDDLPSDRKAVWHQGRLFSVPERFDFPENDEGYVEARVTFEGRLPKLEEIRLITDITDAQAEALPCASGGFQGTSVIFDWRMMSLGVCTTEELDNQFIVLGWGAQ